jgi:glutamyl-Q tRNA(Asp) synthetase
MRVVDRSLGEIRFDPTVLRDVIVQRRDGVYAYHLACVVDDAFQGVTDVVRGADLLPSTAWQLALHEALGLRPPRYLHLPLVVEADGSKLAKSRHSMPVEAAHAAKVTRQVLRWLKQEDPPAELQSVAGLLDFAKAHWDPRRFNGVREVPVTDCA